jgi:hypothetical protein
VAIKRQAPEKVKETKRTDGAAAVRTMEDA